MTEYQEITWDMDYSELVRCYLYQLGLGYLRRDSFPQYILERMEVRYEC